MPAAENEKLRQSLLEVYDSLPPLEQAVLQLMSIAYEGVTKSRLIECARRCGVPPFKIKGFPQPGLTPVLNNLLEEGLAVKDDQNLHYCHVLLAEDVTRRAIRDGHFEAMAKAVQETVTSYNWGASLYFNSYRLALREMRIAFRRGDVARVRAVLEVCPRLFPRDFYEYSPWLLIFNNPFDADDLRALPDELLGEALTTLFTLAARTFEPAPAATALAERELAGNRCADLLRYHLAEQALLRGEAAKVRRYLVPAENDRDRALRGWLAFLEGANEDAIQHYQAALKLLRQRTRKRKIFFDHLAGLFFILALLASNSPARLAQAAEVMAPLFDKDARYPYFTAYRVLYQVVEIQRGQRKQLDPLNPNLRIPPVDQLIHLLARFWLNAAKPETLRKPAKTLLDLARASGYAWFAAELTELLRSLGESPDGAMPAAGDGRRHLVRLFQIKEPWEHALSALLGLTQSAGEAKAPAQTRLVWWIQWLKNGNCAISPREQKRDARGQWTQGRPVALKRLYGQKKPDFLTPQDREICASIRPVYGGYHAGTHYEIDTAKALPLLVGHPLVFWEDNPAVRVELIRGEPELLITPAKEQWRLELSPKALPEEPFKVVKETPTRLKVIEFGEAHRRVMGILGEGLLVPEAARPRVLEAVAALSGLVTVQSSIDTGVDNLEEVAADSLPRVHLLPFGEGLKIELRVRPFATGGPSYRPGAGGERVIAEIDGKRVQARRDLKLERRRVAQVVAAVPSLSRQPTVGGEWILPDPETCLEALLELQALGDRVILEWPEGEKFKVGRPAALSQLRLSIKRHRDWFDLDGELCLDEQVFNMRQLLELIEQAPGRFLPLGEGRFLALTEEFRKRLEELRGFGEPSAKGVRFHPLAAQALEPLTAEAGVVRADADWKAQLQRLREAEALQPAVPSTLQAELRDYQAQGFEWLARLAHWGVGACLADDMGLGKTVQALALILNRAQDGPALVVAPTSVCLNWLDEIRRFTPTLNPIRFGGGDREQTLARLGPFDLLICSYGLLQQEAERLAKTQWRTLVLDEAQAIKNMATKRSQAAMALRGDFKMLTTGTPIENHLGELWNLFRFINPGLLGSLERFNQRFATPIERDQDVRARHRLKQLIQPFILRRLKSEVLEALPSRTEILRRVELGPEEAALYEALRQQALARLARVDDADGQKPFQILAEIMKLRRACCHPKLALPDTDLGGAKLAAFEEILDELLENRHKALVFSQFVDHLAIIRELLDRKGVAYQYLDGSTPAAERKRGVDAFQAGRGDVFLISLKAGGLGLNLTAADFVIHMDPWWNPAVEDQASDRAHRIGQQRPVTIYRLVAQGTIEEKIVALHHQKRDLAEQLLEGTGAGGRISAEDLLRLLRQE
jgi:superfamily II DNA or RNA helicase